MQIMKMIKGGRKTTLLWRRSLQADIKSQIEAIDERIKSMQQEILLSVNSFNIGDEIGIEIRKLSDKK